MTTPTDVSVAVAELRQQSADDHVRGCMGHKYSCDCGFDLRTEGLLEQVADLLEQMEAERQELKARGEKVEEPSKKQTDALSDMFDELRGAITDRDFAEALVIIDAFERCEAKYLKTKNLLIKPEATA